MKKKESKTKGLISVASRPETIKYALLGIGNLGLLATAVYLYITTHNSFLMLGFAFMILALNSLAFYQRGRDKKKDKLQNDFIRLFTYFSIYMENGYPVYAALRESKRYASPILAALTDELLASIDVDKSIRPFLVYSDHFDSVAIRQVMVSVYQMVEEGYCGTYVHQFQNLFGSLSATKRREKTIRETKKLENFTIYPLVGSGISMAMVAVSIVELVGGMLSGI